MRPGSWYRGSYELIIFATNGDSKREFDTKESDVWRIKPINFTLREKRHQAEKPVELMERIKETLHADL